MLVLGVERVRGRAQHDLVQVRVAARRRRALEPDAVVVDAQQLVDHGLVRPLREQGRDAVVRAIQDQQEGPARVRRRRPSFKVEDAVRGDGALDLRRDGLGHRRGRRVADRRRLDLQR